MGEQSIVVSILAAAVTAGTPILYAALGELLTERAGVLNLGVEGIMLVGAVTGFIAAVATGSCWWGLLAAMLASGAVAFIHGVLSITLRANQTVSGLALSLFGTGLSGYLGKSFIGMPVPQAFKATSWGRCPISVYRAFLFRTMCLFTRHTGGAGDAFFIYRTASRLISGDRRASAAADALGFKVCALRHMYVVAGGCWLRGRRVSVAGVCAELLGEYDGRPGGSR
jgi:simple sugar transport system permease protein